MMVGDRVKYVGTHGWIGQAMQKNYPEGAVVIDVEGGVPVIKWPSGAIMIVGTPSDLVVTQTLEEMFAKW